MNKGDGEGIRGWLDTLAMMEAYVRGEGHLDQLLEDRPTGSGIAQPMAVFREWLTVDALIASQVKQSPRPKAQHLLRLALTELRQAEASTAPKVVHHAIEVAKRLRLSKGEQGFINGVLRNLLRQGSMVNPERDLQTSHPSWMLDRWRRQFGAEAVQQLMQWNQSIPPLYIFSADPPEGSEPTEWPGFHRVLNGRWPEVRQAVQRGKATVMDPFARIPVDLLDPKPGERILDLCAAPGGKSMFIASRIGDAGHLIAIDKPGPRLERLRANLGKRYPGVDVVASRIEDLEAISHVGSSGFSSSWADAVLIDVPCSNTGVIRRRPDIKLRLSEKAIRDQAQIQVDLLSRAATWAKRGGRLVYSTCSLEAEENQLVIDAFLATNPEWRLEQTRISLPWECRHDGGAAFLLRK